MTDNQDLLCRPCRVCGETRPQWFKMWFDGYLKLYRCKSCGFVAQFPGPGNSTIVSDYQDRYSLSFLDKGQEFKYPERRRVLQDIVKRISALREKGSVLDVGCGDGHFLYLCSHQGFRCYGVEDSKVLSSYALQKTGAEIVQGQYKTDMFPQNSFDIISFIQVLEHISTPITALEIAKYHLRPNGILIVEVPSIRSPHFLCYQWTGIRKFVKPPNGVIYSHYGYYSPNTLKSLTDKCGFEKISIVTGRWQYKYSGLMRHMGKVLDPLLNTMKVGGILYIGRNVK